MRKLNVLFLISLFAIKTLFASPYNDYMFKKEIKEGLNIYNIEQKSETKQVYGSETDSSESVTRNEYIETKSKDTPEGELGYEVYNKKNKIDTLAIYIPTNMYIRGGVATNLNITSNKNIYFDDTNELYYLIIPELGLGLNLSSFVRTEINLSSNRMYFKNSFYAYSHQINTNLQFDLIKRYFRTGDIIRRNHLIPFIGGGVNFGEYNFEQKDMNGYFISPEAIFGINIVLTNLLSFDVTYKHQFYLSFNENKIINNGNLFLSIRMNF